ncbi:MAG: CHAD domain-containing protein [Sedimentisphaerales bacterium]|nr:CHAD domain-containing protein [Sedimentisphaerales bacterium]
MAYRLDLVREVEAEVQRVATEQIDKALVEIRDEQSSQADTIHQVRKRCKKLRALVRLVRGALADPGLYAFENASFRDAARSLSAVRDAEVLVETYDKLTDASAGNAEWQQFGAVRAALVRRRDELTGQKQELAEGLKAFSETMTEARQRVTSWHLSAEGFDAVASGFARTYRRGRRAMSATYDDLTGASFHEWRKRVKYHWYHCRLLRHLWVPVMKARIGELDRLATLLGDYHDLDVLAARLVDLPNEAADEDTTAQLRLTIGRRQEQIRQEARPRGERLFAEKTKHLRRRVQAYWNASQE